MDVYEQFKVSSLWPTRLPQTLVQPETKALVHKQLVFMEQFFTVPTSSSLILRGKDGIAQHPFLTPECCLVQAIHLERTANHISGLSGF